MSENTLFRIHPTIGIARVGNSKDYYLGPETMAGMPSENGDGITGGLPIQKDTDSTTILSKDLRETDTGLLKRQAARFKIFQYDGNDTSYPSGGGTEVKVKDVITVNGEQKTVKGYRKSSSCYSKAEQRARWRDRKAKEGQGCYC